MLEFVVIHCPACGERFEIAIDSSAGAQDYIEDCQVCCRPMQVHVDVDADGNARARVAGEDDA